MDSIQNKVLDRIKTITGLLLLYLFVGVGVLIYLYVNNILGIRSCILFLSLGLMVNILYGYNMLENMCSLDENRNYKKGFFIFIKLAILLPTILIILGLLNFLMFYKIYF